MKNFFFNARYNNITMIGMFVLYILIGLIILSTKENKQPQYPDTPCDIRVELMSIELKATQAQNKQLHSLMESQQAIYDSYFIEDYGNGVDVLNRELYIMHTGDVIRVERTATGLIVSK